MKNSILFLTVLIFFSCQSQGNKADSIDEKVNIQLNGIDEHPNKESMEYFLNNYEEEFIPSKDGKTLTHENLIQKRFDFRTELSNVSLILIFFENEPDLFTFRDANCLLNEVTGDPICGSNGIVLFIVQAADQYDVNDVLGWFSGVE